MNSQLKQAKIIIGTTEEDMHAYVHHAPSQGDFWETLDISRPERIIYDRIETLDIDLDGDQDLLTREEATVVGNLRWGLEVI